MRSYFILFFISSLTGFSQDISQETILLKRISELQVQKDSFYHAGMFPTLRTNARNTNIVKHDNNIFFTALVAFSLKQLRNNFTPAQQVICDTIVQRAYRAYPYFKHHTGRPSYNFWPTDHPVIFPNNRLLNLFNQSQALPDDIDDTSMVWLSQDAPDSVVAIIHDLMIKHTNAARKQIRNTFKLYKNIPAYSTWFGNKMPIDFDFSALCNALYFLYDRKVSFTKYDSATINLLRLMIVHKQYKTDAAYISPHYGRTSILLYHISRLLNRFSIVALDSLKPQLLQDAYTALNKSDNMMDSVLLSTCIVRLGGSVTKCSYDNIHFVLAEQNRFVFFMASFASMMPNPFKQLFLGNSRLKFYYSCAAYNLTLILENLILQKK